MPFTQEIIVDNFAGGGGASTGIELATGRSVDIAINHDPAAIAMHRANHPETEHYCESVWDVDPRVVTRGRPVALCWLSPDCKHFSKAKGGKPKDKGIRSLAWVAVRWAATVRPRVIMLENVEEFKTWGPLLKDGMPDPDKKGKTFQAFVNALKRQGYQVEWRELRACDYGAPTIRKRFFLIARCDGRPIVWPEPTHGDPNSPEVKSGKLKPWRTAAEIIDWSLPCPSIFERKKPLAENTLRRIARGIQKFVIDNPSPFIIRVNYSGSNHHYCDPIDEPLKTITAKNGWGVVVPTLIQTGYGERKGQAPRSLNLHKPLGTVVAGGAKHALVAAFLAQYHSETASHEARGQTLDRPILTLDTSNRYALVASHLVKMRGTNTGQPVTVPLQTITAGGNHFGEVRAFLMAYYGSSVGQNVDDPLGTVTTRDRFGLVTIYGQDYQIVDIGMRMLEPHELFAAQGFPNTYIIERDADGKTYPKSAQVARCGNSVPPPFAEALVRANLPEHCAGAGNVAVFERYKEQPAGQLALSI
ncbi:C-5 cytosine-specific DNA methylase [Brevibacillus borstelensis AK1]|uniref:DNA (cytosine-5-)-methyltransferase n=1 Tax=Brevibacillus borstelensis AK1 TaxID=1300222 RepID=M8E4Q3_9BACL|nr:DNA cytosine methyltransferase [Brevibacillus borstelensis]EMT54261.1 C-5 cytosine-specific DNA methylase [Brevibacillus borstelensis AK1]